MTYQIPATDEEVLALWPKYHLKPARHVLLTNWGEEYYACLLGVLGVDAGAFTPANYAWMSATYTRVQQAVGLTDVQLKSIERGFDMGDRLFSEDDVGALDLPLLARASAIAQKLFGEEHDG